MRRPLPSEAAWPAAPHHNTGPPALDATDPAKLSAGVIHVSNGLNATVDRLTWRLEDIAKALGISRRALERARSAGRLPRPDMILGRMPLWKPETIRAWVERGGHA